MSMYACEYDMQHSHFGGAGSTQSAHGGVIKNRKERVRKRASDHRNTTQHIPQHNTQNITQHTPQNTIVAVPTSVGQTNIDGKNTKKHYYR
jgi:hypothetical protein